MIDSPAFQRLRRVKQLGTGHLIYHGAEHTRFGHSLGVMEVATKMFRAIKAARPELFATEDEWDKYEQIVRLMALLHDVGHPPYSHASEELLPEGAGGKPLKHEDYTASIIMQSGIKDLIDDGFRNLEITAGDVVSSYMRPSTLDRAGVLLQNIVAGELDADRLDYLTRDSLYAGVGYGRYDLDRLLDTITAVEDEDGLIRLAVQSDGRHALEGFLLARYYMFLQVYLHRYRRFYDMALTNTITSLLKDAGGRYPSPEDWQTFLAMDDVWIDSRARELVGAAHPWATSLYQRKHWKCIAEHVRGTLDRNEPAIESAEWMEAVREVQKNFGDENVAVDYAHGKNFQATEPGPYIGGSATKEDEAEGPRILLLTSDGQADRVENVSGIVRELSRDQIRIRRLYARPELKEAVSLELAAALARRG